MVVIRPEKPRDYAGIHEVNRVAFRREGEARLVENLRRTPGFVPELAIVAVGGKNVVGYALFSPVSLTLSGGEISALVLMPIAVRPEYLKEDVDIKLARHGLKECRRQGYRCVVAIGPSAQYARYGFTPAQHIGLRTSSRIPGGELMVFELAPGAFDGITGTLRFPPVYSDLWEAVTL